MPSAKQLREQADLQAVRDRAHVGMLREADHETVECALSIATTVLRERAEHLRADKRRGWDTGAKGLDAAADRLGDLLALLDANPPPTNDAETSMEVSSGPNPHRDPLPPDHKIKDFVSPLAAAGTSLVTVAGVTGPPVVHITAKLTHITATGHHERLNLPREFITICGAAPPALRSYRGTANCPDCIRHFDAAARLDAALSGVVEVVGHPLETPAAVAPPPIEIPPCTCKFYASGDPETPDVEDDPNCPRHGEGIRSAMSSDELHGGAYGMPSDAGMEMARKMGSAWPSTADAMAPPPIETTAQEWTKNERIIGGPIEAYDNPSTGDVPRIERPTLAAPVPNATDFPARQRMAVAEVVEHGRRRARGAEHRSYSQVSGFEECGTRFALSDMERRPAWWNVGGNAVHSTIETINRHILMDHDPTNFDTPGRWAQQFARTVAEVEYTSGVPHEHWRAAAKGSEAYDWWRVEGEAMVSRWLDFLVRRYAAGWRLSHVEHEISLPVDGVPVPVTAILDAVLHKLDPSIPDGGQVWEIVDIKAGKSAPRDSFQIAGLYHWALWRELRVAGHADPCIDTSYWLARSDSLIPQPPIAWSDVVARVSMMDRAERQGLYVARPGIFCGSCEVRDLCPSGPQA